MNFLAAANLAAPSQRASAEFFAGDQFCFVPV
jgi:hypothetical protein